MRLLAFAETGLGKRTAVQALSPSKTLGWWPHTSELAQSFGSDWPASGRANRVAEKSPCLFRVARREAVLGCGDSALVHTLDRIYQR